MDSNQFFNIEFKHRNIIDVNDVIGSNSLRLAVEGAENGDQIIVMPGTYDGGIDLGGKEIELIGQ